MNHYFYFGTNFEFLFKQWNVTTITGLVFTVLSVFCLAIFYESLRVVIAGLHKTFYSLPLIVYLSSTVDQTLSNSVFVTDSLNYVRSQRIKNHLLQTTVHCIKVLLAYLLMLAVMTYNTYIVLAAIVGATLGYFVFGFRVDSFFKFKNDYYPSANSSLTSNTNVNSNEEIKLSEDDNLLSV